MPHAQAPVGSPHDSAAQMGFEWRRDKVLVGYADALAFMDMRAAAIRAGTAGEMVWLLEHPALYSAGTSAREHDLLVRDKLPVYRSGRGGQFTYHGPGQRVAYVMLDLTRRRGDVRAFVRGLETWIIAALARLGVHGRRSAERIGVWIDRTPVKGAGHEDKIAAIGVRVRRGVTLHGVALNVAPDLAAFAGIVPCGIVDPRFGVTSLADLGVAAEMDEVDRALEVTFAENFAI
jgi:lipoyl(octanoyl) transferase